MESRIIIRNVIMEPNDIKEDREKFLLKILRENRAKLHSLEDGFIVKIVKILDKHNIVSNVTGNIIFTVKFLVKSITLKTGLEIPVVVKMVLTPGILCQYYDIKIWIPSIKTNGFKFISNTFIKGKNQIIVGHTITAKLSEIRYEKKSFSCIASLIT